MNHDCWNEVVSFSKELLNASHDGSEKCSEKLLKLLQAYFNLKACSLYTFSEDADVLTLRAQIGLSYSKYRSFHLPLNSTAGRALRKSDILFVDDLKKQDDYIDVCLIDEYELENMVVVPLSSSECIQGFKEDICQAYIGAICIYPNSYQELKDRKDLLENLSSLIGAAYIYSVKVDRLRIRKDMVTTSMSSPDLNSFLHKSLQMLVSKWNIESGSIFLEDERNGFLRLHATTGIESNKERVEIYYTPSDNTHTSTAFHENELLVVSNPENGEMKCKYQERVSSKVKRSLMFIPITEPPHPHVKKSRTIGVLRVVNRKIKRDNVIEYGYFGWEDVSLLSFVAEVIGIFSSLFRKNHAIVENYERAMHGVNKNIRTVKSNLEFLVRNSNVLRDMPKNMTYTITNSISFMEALQWQITKHETRERYTNIDTSRVKLTGDVLSKIVVFLNDGYEAFNVNRMSVNNLVDSGFLNIPDVRSNSQALQVVFRNLAENSMKYCSRDRSCKVNISWVLDDGFVKILFRDFGLGIDEKDRERLFTEGFRSEEAMRRDPLGTGLGLAHSKEIMKTMRGDLQITKAKPGTEFVVSIPLA